MQGVQGYVWLKLITPTIIVPTDHGFWKPRGGVLGFIASRPLVLTDKWLLPDEGLGATEPPPVCRMPYK